jgi:alanine racemase
MISLYDLLEAANGQLFGEPNARLFTGFCLDSRFAQADEIYVARKTDRGDTQRYVREAVERGVTGVLCVQPPDIDTDALTVIIVRDSEQALMNWAHFVLGRQGTKVIAVAGSSGKTVTCEAISRVLATRYQVYNGAGDYQYGRLQLPLALSRLRPEHQQVVFSLTTTQPGEMAELVQAIQPDSGVVLHIGHAYTESFAGLDQIAQETGVLVEYLSPTGLAVLNYDNDHVRSMISRSRAQVRTVGMADFGADFMAYNIVVGLTQTGFDLRHGTERFLGRWTPLLGRHQLYSVLAALAVGAHYEVPLDDGLRALTEMQPLPGRMSALAGLNGSLIIDDTYDATPESTLYSLDWLQSQRGGHMRTIFVMGDMDNLGAYSQRAHRMIGQRALDACEVLITEGAEAAQVGRAALDQGMERRNVAVTYNLQDTLQVFQGRFQLSSADVLLVKGGQAARMEHVVRALLESPDDSARLARQGAAWQSVDLLQNTQTTWVEIDQGAIAHNVRLLRQMIGPQVGLMAVVKADAYGHGAVATSLTALANGAEILGVASLEEALALREAGIEAPILVMSYTPVNAVRQAIRQGVTLTLYDLDMGHAYNRAARELGSHLKVHIKVDTGMGRLGVMHDKAVAFFRFLLTTSHLDVEGVYTHFSMADEDLTYTAEQLRRFKNVINPVRANGFNFRYIHAANSAAILTMPDSYFNLVRAGIALHGLSPSPTVPIPPEFRPAMTWKTVIAQVKTLPPGSPVGYGQSYVTSEHEQIAVIPVGYSHGFRRKPHHWGQVLVNGQYAPVVGRVSMEKTTINVSHIPDVTIGTEVVLLGQQGEARISAEDVARHLETNNYEVVCNVLARVPRQ